MKLNFLTLLIGLLIMTNGLKGQDRMPKTTSINDDSKYEWLEDVDSKKSLEWVEKKNEETLSKLMAHPKYQAFYDKSLEIMNSTDRIAFPSLIGKYVYNYWQDAANPRGLWRRMLKADYLTGEKVWETVIDIDQLSKDDNKKWVFKGASPLPPANNKFLVSLSNGGGDATVVREFDGVSKTFVKGGFELPESKGGASWIDENSLFVSIDFGSGSMTTSGYPSQAKIWKRGTPLADAKLIFEGQVSDVSTSAFNIRHLGKNYQFVNRGITFYTSELRYMDNGKLIKFDVPNDASFSGMVGDQAIIELKSDWKIGAKTFKQGSVISIKFTDLVAGKKTYKLAIAPEARASTESVSTMGNAMLVSKLVNVKSELYKYTFVKGAWVAKKINAPALGAIGLTSADDETGEYFFSFQNFLNPASLYYGNLNTGKTKLLQSLPNFFDPAPYDVKQIEATSKDGTKIPYFVIAKKGLALNGKNPVLINAYGGFEVSILPFYSATIGKLWLEEGGVFVLANIRGGGEFGPKWHQAGLKEKRQAIYDDFHAVAEDLIAKKYTDGKHIGISGGSNGGLLVGVAFTQRPDLYNAVLCQVPLLDMKRYNKLLAGASWMGEYGNPDIPEEWECIKKYSPFQNLNENMNYPEVFFTTSTRDDRVHPGHARKMAAKMEDMGYKFYYFENTEGGHAGSSTNEQRAKTSALTYVYLLKKLM